MYTHLAVLVLNMVCCFCFVNHHMYRDYNTSVHQTQPSNTNINEATSFINEFEAILTDNDDKEDNNNIKATHNKKPEIKVRQFIKTCPETEKPLSMGTFEIPTQRDLVLFTKRTLMKLFNSYHEKTLFLLKDIKEATRATVELEKKCNLRGRVAYRSCVKQISKKFIAITKGLVAALERQKQEVDALTQDKICDMTSMRTDPIQLIKILAMDDATMAFALPAFLRLLGGCTAYCSASTPPDRRPRLRHLTDQDLVVRHLLTSKNYVQLLNDNNTYV